MTPRECTVHTHSTLCDGKNTLAEMAAAAYAAGVRYFGASGHSHTPVPSDEGNVLPADPAAYRAEVLRLRAEYAGRMEVLLGVEWDSRSDGERAGFDYWIGSVHELYAPETGRYYCVDWEPESLAACRQRLALPLITERLDALDIMELELRHAEGQDSWTISCESLIGSATWVLLPPVFSMITPKKSECIQFVELFELLADAVVNNRPAET